jgi:hypothetical protein
VTFFIYPHIVGRQGRARPLDQRCRRRCDFRIPIDNHGLGDFGEFGRECLSATGTPGR